MAEDIIEENIIPMSYDDTDDDMDNNGDEAETQVYEVGFHIMPEIDKDKVAFEADTIKSLIKKNGGELITDEPPKFINLTYTISKDIEGKKQKFDTAYFGWIKFEMKTNSITTVKKEIDDNKNVLRFLIIKTVKESTLAPKTAAFAKENSLSKEKLKSALKKKDNAKKKVFVSEEELDKTIEELMVD